MGRNKDLQRLCVGSPIFRHDTIHKFEDICYTIADVDMAKSTVSIIAENNPETIQAKVPALFKHSRVCAASKDVVTFTLCNEILMGMVWCAFSNHKSPREMSRWIEAECVTPKAMAMIICKTRPNKIIIGERAITLRDCEYDSHLLNIDRSDIVMVGTTNGNSHKMLFQSHNLFTEVTKRLTEVRKVLMECQHCSSFYNQLYIPNITV